MWDRIQDGLWWDKTLSLVSGCSKVSPGCDHCWAEMETRVHAGKKDEKSKLRYGNLLGESGWNGTIREMWGDLDKINPRQKPMVYTVWNDLFHPHVTWKLQYAAFGQFKKCPQHTFIVCTKRPERAVRAIMVINRLLGIRELGVEKVIESAQTNPLPNVIIMTTVENQEQADIRIPLLLQIPAAKRALSVEPMLGPIDLSQYYLQAKLHTDTYLFQYLEEKDRTKLIDLLDWVVCGGESGKGARPVHPDWVRSLRDQCVAAGVPFMFKQWGNWSCVYDRDNSDPRWAFIPEPKSSKERYINLAGGHGFHGDHVCFTKNVGKKAAGRLLDGRTWDEHPV